MKLKEQGKGETEKGKEIHKEDEEEKEKEKEEEKEEVDLKEEDEEEKEEEDEEQEKKQKKKTPGRTWLASCLQDTCKGKPKDKENVGRTGRTQFICFFNGAHLQQISISLPRR